MLDGPEYLRHIHNMSRADSQSASAPIHIAEPAMSRLVRGHIVAASGGLLLVWSVGEADALCLPISRQQRVLFGHPFRRVRSAGATVVGKAEGHLLADARVAAEALADRASDIVNHRPAHPSELDRQSDGPRVLGKVFWNGQDMADGCTWNRGHFGRS